MEAKKANFKKFLQEIVENDGWNIREIFLNTGQHTWREDVEQAVEYMYSIKPEDVGLWMTIGRSGRTSNHVCVNSTLQRIYIPKPEKVDENFKADKAYILQIAQKYGFQKVNKWEELYPAKDVALDIAH